MQNSTEQRVLKILNLFFHGEYPRDVADDVRAWLLDDVHKNEKDMALKKIWDEMVVPDNNPTKESYSKTCKSYDKLAKRLGIPGLKDKKTLSR